MNDTYKRLADIVSKKIKTDNVPLEASLTDLGLDSLDKAEIMINIEDEFGFEFEEEEMFDVKTVQDLLDLINKKIA